MYTPKFSAELKRWVPRPHFCEGPPAPSDPTPGRAARDIGTGSEWRAGACHLASMVKYLAMRKADADADAEEIGGRRAAGARRAKSTKRRAKSKRWLSHKIRHCWVRSGLGRSQQGGAPQRFRAAAPANDFCAASQRNREQSRYLRGSDESQGQQMRDGVRQGLSAAIDGAAIGVATIAVALLLLWWMLPI